MTITAIGLGALTNAAQFATAAQGTKADSALQPTGDGSQLTGITAAKVGADSAGAAATVQANLNSATNVLWQALLNNGPYGDLTMGSYTNRAQ